MYLENENILHKKGKNFEYLQFKKLLIQDDIIHAFSLKPLNFRNREGMFLNYKKLFEEIDVDIKCLVKPTQSHTDNVLILNEKKNINEPDVNLDYLQDVDGIITNKKGIALATTNADCLCIILYDKSKKVIANVHSGWRGTFKKIIQKAVLKMIEVYGCNPKDIIAYFSPAIRKCCFEVDIDVMNLCVKTFNYMDMNDKIISIGRVDGDKQKYNIDNILINKILLKEVGILEENIIDSKICSFCNSQYVHSRRANGENFGLGTLIVMMK